MGFRQRNVKPDNYDSDRSAEDVPILDIVDDSMNGGNKGWKKVQEDIKCEYRLLEYHAVPDYLKDNEYILSHYRADLTFSQAFGSLFKLHNETVNIWSHLLGFLFFFILTAMTAFELWQWQSSISRCEYDRRQENGTSESCVLILMKQRVSRMMGPMLRRSTRWPFFIFMGGSMFCLLASTVCHLFTCHSKPLAILLMRIDYTGIAVMIATSFFPPIYYIFQCTPIWQWVYLGTISTLALVAVIVLFAPVCQTPRYRPFRTSLFLSMGASGLIPAVHAVATNWHEPLCGLAVAHEASMAALYALGAMIYVIRIPERWKPGMFDLGGHSHNLFHVLVIAGAYVHYRAAILFLEWSDSKVCS